MDNYLARDEARVNLHLGMKKWILPGGTENGWNLIVPALRTLMALEGLGVDDILQEVTFLEEELNYTDDDILDLDRSIRDLLSATPEV
jgi:hypothetical protein